MRTGLCLTAAAFALTVAGVTAAPVAAAQGGLEVYPATAVPGGTVTVSTTACGARGSAAVEAGTLGPGPFTLAPVPSAPGPAPDPAQAAGRFAVPASAQPGTYEIVARCSDGTEVTGDLIVSLAGTGAGAGAPGPQMPRERPREPMKAGTAGPLGPDPVPTAAGVAALAVAAAGGTWLLHRRARGDGL
ncbi:hypothetical protein OKJ48_30355 [Streptomyces kunmingensis]|uniref:Sortase n=1 Tax=Streptomyces kunmingensis TaxID=68225 RepID=A0ABU6CJD7_9ACTN|nr:hypothetical protein [Streptomyces kunmingensis]MEB3964500.1 hypothetical protein [Streptomyces kunmingensis]